MNRDPEIWGIYGALAGVVITSVVFKLAGIY